jgi:hypothetical protein
MRLVVDTNVFVSAALKENSLPFLVVRWITRRSAEYTLQLSADAPPQECAVPGYASGSADAWMAWAEDRLARDR